MVIKNTEEYYQRNVEEESTTISSAEAPSSFPQGEDEEEAEKPQQSPEWPTERDTFVRV